MGRDGEAARRALLALSCSPLSCGKQSAPPKSGRGEAVRRRPKLPLDGGPLSPLGAPRGDSGPLRTRSGNGAKFTAAYHTPLNVGYRGLSDLRHCRLLRYWHRLAQRRDAGLVKERGRRHSIRIISTERRSGVENSKLSYASKPVLPVQMASSPRKIKGCYWTGLPEPLPQNRSTALPPEHNTGTARGLKSVAIPARQGRDMVLVIAR